MNLSALLPFFLLCFETSTQPEFPIGPSDLIEISVYGVPDLSREVRVSNVGTIRLPFLGEIEVAGLTSGEAENRLKELLSPEYINNPQVSVFVKEPRSRMFSIVGAVTKPGQYQMLQPITLVNAIAGAGGLDLSRAGPVAIVRRTSSQNSDEGVTALASMVDIVEDASSSRELVEVDLKKLMHEGELGLDIPIRPGDVISIPERLAEVFYVLGDVNTPGPIEFPVNTDSMWLSRAVAMAGGPTKTSKLKDTSLIRQNSDGSIDKIALNLDQIFRGRSPDLEIRPNDMIYVPGSAGKTLAWGMLGVVPYTLSRIIVPYGGL